MNLKDELMTDRGQAIGFGRVKSPKIPAINFDLDVPRFAIPLRKQRYLYG